jgi:prevent-host-death family protein
MTTLTAAEFRANSAELLNRVAFGGERLVVSRRGRPLAALVPLEDLKRLEETEDAQDAEDFRRAKRECESSGEKGIPLEDVARDLGVDLKALRQSRRHRA